MVRQELIDGQRKGSEQPSGDDAQQPQSTRSSDRVACPKAPLKYGQCKAERKTGQEEGTEAAPRVQRAQDPGETIEVEEVSVRGQAPGQILASHRHVCHEDFS